MKSLAKLRYTGAVLWVVFTVSLAAWWMYFEMDQARQLSAITGPDAAQFQRVQRMLRWEGSSFIVLLIGGGVALIVSLRREQVRQNELQTFFMAFTHDLKTALASLQLQVESLEEDLPEAVQNPNLIRLKKDALRLQLQLENSLFLAQPLGGTVPESVNVAAFLTDIAVDWPELVVATTGDATVHVDRRALGVVMRNVLQNAARHGAATRIDVAIRQKDAGRVEVTLHDNGRGLAADDARGLGLKFVRPTATSGTGVGLYVSHQLATRMRGTLAFSAAPDAGFTARLDLPKAG